MALIKKVRGFEPLIGKNCYLADNATIIGDVVIGWQFVSVLMSLCFSKNCSFLIAPYGVDCNSATFFTSSEIKYGIPHPP